MGATTSPPERGSAAEPIVVAGEALVDLVVPAVGHIEAQLGGGPYNAARTIGRLDRPVRFLGTLSRDSFGRQLRQSLASDRAPAHEGLDVDAPTTLAIAEIDSKGAASYRFYVQGTSAPALTSGQVATALPAGIHSLHVGTLGLVLEPMATTLEALVTAPPSGALVSIDPNCRPSVIGDADAYRARLDRCARHAHLVKLSDDDARFLAPGADPERTAERFLDMGATLVILTRGADGATAISSRWSRHVSAPEVEVVDTVGAGDAFAGAFLAWWSGQELGAAQLSDEDLVLSAAGFASTVAAIVCTRRGADPPYLAELEERGLGPAAFI